MPSFVEMRSAFERLQQFAQSSLVVAQNFDVWENQFLLNKDNWTEPAANINELYVDFRLLRTQLESKGIIKPSDPVQRAKVKQRIAKHVQQQVQEKREQEKREAANVAASESFKIKEQIVSSGNSEEYDPDLEQAIKASLALSGQVKNPTAGISRNSKKSDLEQLESQGIIKPSDPAQRAKVKQRIAQSLAVNKASVKDFSAPPLHAKLVDDLQGDVDELQQAVQASLRDVNNRPESSPNQNQIGVPKRRDIDYKNDATMRSAFEVLHGEYPLSRPIRGDGNCYYRALMYGLIEQVVLSPSRAVYFQQLSAKFKPLIGSFSGQYDAQIKALVAKLDQAARGQLWPNLSALEEDMRNPQSTSDRELIWGARVMLAVATMRTDFVEGTFQHYAPNADSNTQKQAYIQTILTYGEDARDAALDMSLLPNALGINSSIIEIETQGKSKGRMLSIASNQNGDLRPLSPTVCLLLLPGHYDLLYSAEQAAQVEQARPKPSTQYKQQLHATIAPQQAVIDELTSELIKNLQDRSQQVDAASKTLVDIIRRYPGDALNYFVQVIDRLNELNSSEKPRKLTAMQIKKLEDVKQLFTIELEKFIQSQPHP